MMKHIFIVEGNVSSGKTEIVKALSSNGYKVFEEPLAVWKERYVEKDGKNILGLFYEDMKTWSFPFQVAALVTRWKDFEAAIECPEKVVVLERSIFTDDRVFAPNLYEMGEMTDMQWKIYKDWYEMFMKLAKQIIAAHKLEFIYVDTNPETCFDRKMGRNRKEEANMVPDYLIKLHRYHELWLLDVDNSHKVHRVDGHKSLQEVLNAVKKIIDSVL